MSRAKEEENGRTCEHGSFVCSPEYCDGSPEAEIRKAEGIAIAKFHVAEIKARIALQHDSTDDKPGKAAGEGQ